MKPSVLLCKATLTAAVAVQVPAVQRSLAHGAAADQLVVQSVDGPSSWPPPPPYQGVGHLSEWSRRTKNEFLHDVSANNASDWVVVMGNEGGDTDSMGGALAWAYHLTHLNKPEKAVALLQTDEDALELRPENKLALQLSKMSSGHRDLLTIDELPIKPFELSKRIRGIVLVDHNVPLERWSSARILSIIDHHNDRGLAPDASPRIVSDSASCSSLVANLIMDAEEQGHHQLGHEPLPVELVELLMRAVALDSGGLKTSKSKGVDIEAGTRLWKRSSWQDEKLKVVMKGLKKQMRASKEDLGTLSPRDLFRRDWKGDAVPTRSPVYRELSLGFASIPYSLNQQILNTPEGTPPEWFAIERAYTSEHGVDVSVCLNKFKDPSTGATSREIALIVAHGYSKRLSERAAEDLFLTLVRALEQSPELDLQPWSRPDGKALLPRRAVWVQKGSSAGRKVVRPICEAAAREWSFEAE